MSEIEITRCRKIKEYVMNDIDKHNLIVVSPTCPGEGYVRVTSELAKQWLEWIDSVEQDIKQCEAILSTLKKKRLADAGKL